MGVFFPLHGYLLTCIRHCGERVRCAALVNKGKLQGEVLIQWKDFQEKSVQSVPLGENSSHRRLTSVFKCSSLIDRKWLIGWYLLKSCRGSCWSLLTHKFLIFQDIEYIQAHYNIEDFINFNHHQQEEHGHLCHFVLNPVFHHYTKYFLKEILRLGHKSSLYYPIYPECVEGKVRRKSFVFLVLNIGTFSHFIFPLLLWMTANRDFLGNVQQTVLSSCLTSSRPMDAALA